MKTMTVRKILVRVPNWLGDAVLCLPALQALRQQFPKASITVLAKPRVAPLFMTLPWITETLEYDATGIQRNLVYYWNMVRKLRVGRYDLAVVFPNSFSTAFLAYLSGAALRVGFASEGRGFLLTHSIKPGAFRQKHLSEEYLDLIRAIGWHGTSPLPRLPLLPLPLREGRPKGKGRGRFLVGMACGAAFGPAKRWFPESFAEVGRRILTLKQTRIILFGTKAESALAGEVMKKIGSDRVLDLCGKTSLDQLMVQLKACDLLITNDSGLMHLASALGVKVVAIFGSTSPVWTGPLGKGDKVLYNKVFCSPCFQRTCHRTDVPYECLSKVTPEQVWLAARKELART